MLLHYLANPEAWKSHFHSNAILLLFQTSTSRCVIYSVLFSRDSQTGCNMTPLQSMGFNTGLLATRAQNKWNWELYVVIRRRAVKLKETRVSAAADRSARRRGSAHAKYSVSHHMVIKPFLLLGLAAEYRHRDVTILARRAVSAARSPTRPADGPLAGSITDDDRRRQQTTDDRRAKQYWPIRASK